MKKLLITIVASSFVLCGCSENKALNTFMVTKNDETYALYNEYGKKLTDFEYTSYEAFNKDGYLVRNKEGEYGFINYVGKQVIPFGEYATLTRTCDMMYGTKKVEEKKEDKKESPDNKKETTDKKKEETKKESADKKKESTESKKTTPVKKVEKYKKSNMYVINTQGKVLYSAGEKTYIYNSKVPVIYDVADETYTILYAGGEELDESGDRVISTDDFNNGSAFVANYKDYSYFYDFVNDSVEVVAIDDPGSYQVWGLDEEKDSSAVVYDVLNKKTVYIDIEMEDYHIIDHKIDSAHYDEVGNIVCKYNGATYILQDNDLIRMNSYYHSASSYITRSSSVYGPHKFVCDEKDDEYVDGCQTYPGPKLVTGTIVPLFFKNKGYVYYNFDGTEAFKGVYKEAAPFEYNGRAVARIDDGYIMIDKSGKQLTKNSYSNIEFIGNSYFAVYNESGLYGIIDSNGAEVLPIQFTSKSKTMTFTHDGSDYLLMIKNGRSYVYDTKNKMNILFSVEGDLEYCTGGYFKSKTGYYTFEGETI